MIGFYDRHILPRLIHGACALPQVTEQRKRVVPHASGIVLEVGIGSGLNLAHYDPGLVERVIGIDPDPTMLSIARATSASVAFEVELIEGSAETIPLERASVDTALITYTLCSIPDLAAALADIGRVLKPGGRLLFCEHGRSHRASTARWQDRITPVWKSLSGGCHLNRDIAGALEGSDFEITGLETFSLPGTPGVLGFHYIGAARPR